MFKDYIVLLHGIMKKSKEVPGGDILKAKNRIDDFHARYKQGNIRLPELGWKQGKGGGHYEKNSA